MAALGAGTLLLRPLLAKSLRDRISRKRANVEEASQAAGPPESSSLKVLSYSSITATPTQLKPSEVLLPACGEYFHDLPSSNSRPTCNTTSVAKWAAVKLQLSCNMRTARLDSQKLRSMAWNLPAA